MTQPGTGRHLTTKRKEDALIYLLVGFLLLNIIIALIERWTCLVWRNNCAEELQALTSAMAAPITLISGVLIQRRNG